MMAGLYRSGGKERDLGPCQPGSIETTIMDRASNHAKRGGGPSMLLYGSSQPTRGEGGIMEPMDKEIHACPKSWPVSSLTLGCKGIQSTGVLPNGSGVFCTGEGSSPHSLPVGRGV